MQDKTFSANNNHISGRYSPRYFTYYSVAAKSWKGVMIYRNEECRRKRRADRKHYDLIALGFGKAAKDGEDSGK